MKLLYSLREQGRCISCFPAMSCKKKEVAALCDRVVIMVAGQVVAEGTPQELCERTGQSSFEEAFVQLIGTELRASCYEIAYFFTIWRKEMLDAIRDRRSLMAAMSYAFFGPGFNGSRLYGDYHDAVSERRCVCEYRKVAEYAPAFVDFLGSRRIFAGTEENKARDIDVIIPQDYQDKLARAEMINIVCASRLLGA